MERISASQSLPIVVVKVTDVTVSGLRVALVEDGRSGFIRAREFSWDRSLEAPRPVFHVGDILHAVIVEDEAAGGSLYLSLRKITDPWMDAYRKRKYILGQMVEGEVVNVRQVGAFVQIEAGIDAIIYPRDVPLLREQAIDDALSLGDRVSAVIASINPANRRIELNLVKRLQALPSSPGELRNFLMQTFGADRRPLLKLISTGGPTTAATGRAPALTLWDHPAAFPSGEQDPYIARLREQAMGREALPEVLAEMLESLARKTGLTFCAVLELDENQQAIRIAAGYPQVDPIYLKLLQDGLYYSPAREVIQGGQEFLIADPDHEANPRYKNFFTALEFASCLWLPVQMPYFPARYGLFLFSDRPDAFNAAEKSGQELLMAARTTNEFLGVAIQRASLLDVLQKFQEKYALGQLVEDLVHEASHKINTLGGEIANFQADLTNQPTVEQLPSWLDKLHQWGEQMKTSQVELSNLVEAYERQRKYEFEAVDINGLVEKAARQVIQFAKRNSVSIFLNRSEDLPEASGIPLHLQQVIVNLLLNAIQMIARQRDHMALIAAQAGQKSALLPSGMIVVQTRSIGVGSGREIEIRVIDSGPGIHRRDQKRIFQAGVTTRGGAGLGLYISRNLIERIGGRLSLFDSVLFIGSVFIVEIPCHLQPGAL